MYKKRTRDPKNETDVQIKWTGLRPMHDFWGNELKRFFQLDTLASATDLMITRGRDTFLEPSIAATLGTAPVTKYLFQLFQEGRYQLIFRLIAGTRDKQAPFGVVVAKNHQECSALAKREHEFLRILHERAPQSIVQTFRGGLIYLPDARKEKPGREIYAYVSQWLDGYEELGVNKELQFIINIEKRHTFTIPQTETLKRKAVEIVVRTYDAAQRNCMAMPEIASGDFVVRMTKQTLDLKLIACRRMLNNVTPAKLINHLLNAGGEWGGKHFRLTPYEPRELFAAVTDSVGRDTASNWFGQYLAAVSGKRLPARAPEYLAALRDIVLKYNA